MGAILLALAMGAALVGPVSASEEMRLDLELPMVWTVPDDMHVCSLTVAFEPGQHPVNARLIVQRDEDLRPSAGVTEQDLFLYIAKAENEAKLLETVETVDLTSQDKFWQVREYDHLHFKPSGGKFDVMIRYARSCGELVEIGHRGGLVVGLSGS